MKTLASFTLGMFIAAALVWMGDTAGFYRGRAGVKVELQPFVDVAIRDLVIPLQQDVRMLRGSNLWCQSKIGTLWGYTDKFDDLAVQFKTDRDLRYEVLVDLANASSSDEERKFNEALIHKLFPDKVANDVNDQLSN